MQVPRVYVFLAYLCAVLPILAPLHSHKLVKKIDEVLRQGPTQKGQAKLLILVNTPSLQ